LDALISGDTTNFLDSIQKANRAGQDRSIEEMTAKAKKNKKKKANARRSVKAVTEAEPDETTEQQLEEGMLVDDEDRVQTMVAEELDRHLEVGLSFKDSASLLLQLAFILQKSRRWAQHSQLRVNFIYNKTQQEIDEDMLVRSDRGLCCVCAVSCSLLVDVLVFETEFGRRNKVEKVL